MGVKYSYDDFTTKGHGVIEYGSAGSDEGKPKRKRRPKKQSKFTKRWPSAAPLKRQKMENFSSLKKNKSQTNKQNQNKEIDKKAAAIFKQRFPGQQPQKGQIKEIRRELLEKSNTKLSAQTNRPKTRSKTTGGVPRDNIIGQLAHGVFKKRFPGQQPRKDQLKKIRQEIIEARNQIGL